jgi:hypothetical protein
MPAKLDWNLLTSMQYPSIKNAPVPADGAGAEGFSNVFLFSLLAGVPFYMAWKIGGGLKTAVFFGLFTTVPILMAFWTLHSMFTPRKNEKARFPGRPVEHYLNFKNEADKVKYSGRNKIPMETFHNMYFDGEVEFNGDCLEVLEYRHDWASFTFTLSLFKFIFFQFAPEVIMHTRSQGTLHSSATKYALSALLQMKSRFVIITTAVTTSTDGSLAHE